MLTRRTMIAAPLALVPAPSLSRLPGQVGQGDGPLLELFRRWWDGSVALDRMNADGAAYDRQLAGLDALALAATKHTPQTAAGAAAMVAFLADEVIGYRAGTPAHARAIETRHEAAALVQLWRWLAVDDAATLGSGQRGAALDFLAAVDPARRAVPC